MAFWNKFPYTDFHELNLDWILQKIGLVDQAKLEAEAAQAAAEQAKADAISAKNSASVSAGSAAASEQAAEDAADRTQDLYDNIGGTVAPQVTAWLNENVDPVGSAVVVDASLSISGAAADAAATGALKSDFGYKYVTDLSDVTLYEHGSINASGVDESYLDGKRTRCPIIRTDYDYRITNVNSTSRIYIYYFNAKGEYVSKNGWINDVIIPKGSIFRLLLAPDLTGEDTDVSITTILAGFTFYKMRDFNDYAKCNYIHGTFYNDGTYGYNANRIISIVNEFHPYPVKVNANTGKFIVAEYDANNNFVRINPSSGWYTSYTIPKNTRYKLILTIDNAPSYEIEDILADFTFTIGDLEYLLETNQQSVLFEHGNISHGDNDSWLAQSRARTEVINVPYDIRIKHNNGVFVLSTKFEGEESFTDSGWYNNDKIVPANTDFRILVALTAVNNQPLTVEELSSYVTIEKVKKTVTLNPNIIYQCRAVDDTVIPPESKWYVKSASENQYDRVRFTIRRTTDGYWFNCHNETINDLVRNADGSQLATTVSANGHTLAELNQYDWGIKYGRQYRGANVPLLDETLKYSALYNLGVTIHFTLNQYETESQIDEVIALLDKYGLTDNAIIITASSTNFTTMNRFKAHNPRTSYYVASDESWWNVPANLESAKSLQTGFNKVYGQIYPWPSYPTETFKALAQSNNIILYNSITMTKDQLLSDATFNNGYELIEATNTYMIKDTIKEWADGLIDT